MILDEKNQQEDEFTDFELYFDLQTLSMYPYYDYDCYLQKKFFFEARTVID